MFFLIELSLDWAIVNAEKLAAWKLTGVLLEQLAANS